jgi:L-alanine-DL-glutamate epimerase-like enolase superfamily enzyme
MSASPDVGLPPYARRLDVRATRAAFAAGTLGTVSDHRTGVDEERRVELRDADRHNADVMHDAKCGWTEAERQAFLRRVQYVDPRERRA